MSSAGSSKSKRDASGFSNKGHRISPPMANMRFGFSLSMGSGRLCLILNVDERNPRPRCRYA